MKNSIIILSNPGPHARTGICLPNKGIVIYDKQKINESDVKKFVLFTEEFIVQNPSCLELKERLKEADKKIDEGSYSDARAIAEDVLNS